tara:strand:+ start:243 stop:959 length:717 start_codon:yes stop_codon:yes gene_type:complete
MIKTYLFEHIYIKFSLMKFLKTFLSLVILINITLSQSTQDIEAENPSSDNWQENYRSLSRNEASINIYSNAAVAEVYVWNSPLQSTERTFPAVISLPTDNRIYTISLYPQSQFLYITNELQNFDFDKKEVEEFELLQDEFERMKLGTKNVRPIPGTGESVFLTYCDSNDTNCEQGMHWLDQFYAKFYDSKQEQVFASELNGTDLTEREKALVRRHRLGVAGMVGFFTMAVFLIDSSAL